MLRFSPKLAVSSRSLTSPVISRDICLQACIALSRAWFSLQRRKPGHRWLSQGHRHNGADVSVLKCCPGRRFIDLVSACYNTPREVDELQNAGSEPHSCYRIHVRVEVKPYWTSTTTDRASMWKFGYLAHPGFWR